MSLVYNSYMEWMENITSAIPLMVSPGNHESECHSPACVVQELKYGRHLSNFTAFNARFNMPSEEVRSGEERSDELKKRRG